jgi:predicted enzyme related to lactoylglutathione lyase
MIEGIGSVPVFVSDQNQALEFYKNGLGFEVSLDMPMGAGMRWLTVTPRKGSTEFILFPPEMAGHEAEEFRKRVGTWTGIVILSDNCRGDYEKMTSRGVTFKTSPTQQAWGGWMAEFSDLDGNRFQLVERPAYMRA